MADGQQSQTPDSIQQDAGTPSPYNETLQNIQELMYKDKSTVMVKAVELLVMNKHQQQEITLLKQAMQDVLVQKEQMRKDVHDQQMIESFMNNIESQNNSTRKQLQGKLETINVHIKSAEILRKQLKKQIGGIRCTIDDLRRRINDKEEEGKAVHRMLTQTAARAEQVSKQRSAVSTEMVKLREECQVKMAELRKIALSCEESVTITQSELAERNKELEHCQKEHETVKQMVAEKVQACSQLQTEKASIQQQCAELNQHYENEVGRMEICFLDGKNRTDEMYAEANDVNQRKVTELEQSISSMTNQTAKKERYAEDLNATVSKVVQQLEEAGSRNKKLKSELEILKLGGNVGNAVQKEPAKNKPNLLTYGRPKAHVFTKNTNPAPPPPQSSISGTEFSYHMDNEESSFNTDANL
uniref:Uncharacterized protein n=1 Tax=Anopheles christyi TaxID=43041 RepID=A0A182JWT3_9DIPT